MLCPISNTYTFTAPAHTGGESYAVVVTRYGGVGNLDVEAYNVNTTTNFSFIASLDGLYHINITGTVSGTVLDSDFVVNHNAKQSIVQLLKEEVDGMMCGECDQGDTYKLVDALLSGSDALVECAVQDGKSGEMLDATDALNAIQTVLKGGCVKKLCSGGC